MATAHINIGSNLGDSRALIERAVAGIVSSEWVGGFRRSGLVESEPWGFGSPHRFLNIGVEVETALPPRELFLRLMEVERTISDAPHRAMSGEYIDRMIDIDLIYYGETVMNDPELTIPHPRMHLREFVLLPVAELAPGWVHPRSGKTAAEMLADLNQGRAISADSIL